MLRERLGKELLYFDGGMGTLLQERGLQPGELPETWNLLHAEEIREIHRKYIEAGSDIVLTNTFGANALKFHDDAYSLEEIVNAAVGHVKAAAEQAGNGRRIYTALDIGPTGKLLKPMGDLDFETAYEAYKEVMIYGEKAGADLIHIETMSDTYELKAAMLAAKENSDLPVMATVIFGENGKMLTGATPEAVTALLEGLGADAFGMNCGLGPKQMKPIFERLAKSASIPLIINPNAGLPRSENGKTVFDVDPAEFAEDMKIFAEEGAWLMGGCCGTTPAHIKALVEACKDAMPKPLTDKNLTLVSSYSHAVELGKMPMLIGERINPTGKSKFKQALRDRNMEYILEMGVKQSDAGAQILDVNVGLPEINEPELMKETVYQLQSILDAPLQIDTTNILFICGGAFPDLENIIKERLNKQASIGFYADLKDKYDNDPHVLEKVTVDDLRAFGMIPEFIGRLPIIFTLNGLTEDMLVKILKEPKNAILKQYQKLLALDEVKLEFEDGALHAIARKALERHTGARALRAILEEYMLDIMYEIPKDDNIGEVVITEGYIQGNGGPKILMRGQETPLLEG